MQKPKLELFDLAGLVDRLNSALADQDEVIELGEFEHREPRRNPFLYRLQDRELEVRGKFPLRQTVKESFFGLPLFGVESDINLGYISIETGYTDASNEDGDGNLYETLRLRIKRPLELANGNVIPNCSVKFLQESEAFAKPYQERRDHVRYGGLLWVRADLSKVLPSEWFLGGRKAEDYEIRDEKTWPV